MYYVVMYDNVIIGITFYKLFSLFAIRSTSPNNQQYHVVGLANTNIFVFDKHHHFEQSKIRTICLIYDRIPRYLNILLNYFFSHDLNFCIHVYSYRLNFAAAKVHGQ